MLPLEMGQNSVNVKSVCDILIGDWSNVLE